MDKRRYVDVEKDIEDIIKFNELPTLEEKFKHWKKGDCAILDRSSRFLFPNNLEIQKIQGKFVYIKDEWDNTFVKYRKTRVKNIFRYSKLGIVEGDFMICEAKEFWKRFFSNINKLYNKADVVLRKVIRDV